MLDWMAKLGLNVLSKHGKGNAMELILVFGLVFSFFNCFECTGHRRQPHIILVVLRDLVSCELCLSFPILIF